MFVALIAFILVQEDLREGEKYHLCDHTFTLADALSNPEIDVRKCIDHHGNEVYNESITPLSHVEQDWFGSFSAQSQGRSSAEVFWHKGRGPQSDCAVKIDIHRGTKTVRCLSSNGAHFGARSSCCSSVHRYYNDINGHDPASLLSNSSSSGSGAAPKVSRDACNAEQCVWPFERPDNVSNFDWIARAGGPDKCTQLFPKSEFTFDVKKDECENEWYAEYMQTVTVYGDNFATTGVQLYSLVKRDSLSGERIHFSGQHLGLFQVGNSSDFFDVRLLYDMMHDSMFSAKYVQMWHDDRCKRYCTWEKTHTGGAWPSFPTYKRFGDIYHSWIRSQVSIFVSFMMMLSNEWCDHLF